MNKIYLDAREMEHPEPLEKAIAILRELDNESCLYMIHRKNPLPLLALAKEHNLNSMASEADGVWHILICIDRDADLESLIENNIVDERF